MMKSLTIGIVGCGPAGLAAALFLSRDGHQVQLIERFEEPKPLGAGLLLQPTGLAVLAALGLDETAIEHGAVINRIYGRTSSGTEIFDLSYRDLRSHYFGLGIHRGTLFGLLYDEAVRLNIPICTGCEINGNMGSGAQQTLIDAEGHEHGPFDLVIDASGLKSFLRPNDLIALNRPYPFGAIWGVVDDPAQHFGADLLQQRYEGAHIMIGMLAIGRELDHDTAKCTFFWSLPPGGYQSWLQQGMESWKAQVIGYWPELEPFLAQFQTADDLTFAEYSDIILKRWHHERLVFIGDAGHSTSPQLGQGANLGLTDALVLASLLRQHRDVDGALTAYSKLRRSPVYFYQWASRWLTPFFQSHSKTAGLVRDLSFGLLCRTPVAKTEMLKTLTGLKTGIFTSTTPDVLRKMSDT